MEPWFGQEEKDALCQYMESGGWLTEFRNTAKFEQMITAYTGAKHCIVVNNGTISLTLAAMACGVTHGDEVIVPNYTMIATPNSVRMFGAKPVFVDVEEATLSMDVDDMKRKYDKDCVAVIPVHFGGHPAKMDEIVPWAHKKSMKVISDCAHVAGGTYKGKKLGTWADISCFSFQEKKILVTGDGGMISSNDESLIEPLRAMKEVGMTKDTFSRYQRSEEHTSELQSH